MATYIFACPICKKQYKLMPKDPATLAQKTFTCPHCHYSAPFSSLLSSLPSSSDQLAQPPSSNEARPFTPLHSPTKMVNGLGTQPHAFLTMIDSGSKFVLQQGNYILGRKSSDSKATLQLAPDICMSRQHAQLSVQATGRNIVVQIVGLKPENPVIINNKVLRAGQPCRLKPGDHLQLGRTHVVFSL